MFSELTYSSSIKSDGLKRNSKRIKSCKCSSNNRLFLNNKNVNEEYFNMKSMDITSRLGQFAWRQIIPSTIILPVIFRNSNREEYLCVEMIKIHLLSRLSRERISFYLNKYSLNQYSLTICEAELFDYINKFHSNEILSNHNNNQLNYSQLDSISLTPLNSFLKFYQIICSTSQFLNSNQFRISSNLSSSLNKSISDKFLNKMSDSNKNLFSKSSETKNSFCREIIYHGKEILSYCTTSSIDFNEKANETISCLAIKDIVSIYFPWSTIEQFIQICRKKQITRFKPDKTTDCDSNLRLINIKQLEYHWNFIIKELLPNKQFETIIQSDQSEKDKFPVKMASTNILVRNNSNDSFISNLNNPQTTNTVQLTLKESFIENSLSKDNQSLNQINNNSQTIEQINEIEKNLSKEEDVSSNIKSLKRKRRRHRICYYSSKIKRRKELKRICNDQFWMNKYSIEPFSILINRYEIPSN